MRIRNCQECGRTFMGTKAARFCHKCRHERAKKQRKEWFAAHREEQNAKDRARNKDLYCLKNGIPQINEQDDLPPVPEPNCQNYQPERTFCVRCMENGTAPYRGCFKKR